MITITINAMINDGTFGQVNNPVTFNCDSSGKGNNDTTALTDEAAVPGATGSTGIVIARGIPALDPNGLLLLALGLIVVGYRRRHASQR